MRHSNTGKSDPQQAPVKRGFFAAAGERLKRAMTGSRAETASAPAAAPEIIVGVETEVTTSVQARARELLTQDRASKRSRPNVVVESDDVANLEPRARKTSPPPLPWQRTAAADSNEVAAAPAVEPQPEATTGTQPVPAVERESRPVIKRPVRDSKSEALRARLGAAKAALAEAQAKRAAEANSDVTEPEVLLELLEEIPSEPGADASQPSAAGDEQSEDTNQLPIASLAGDQSSADSEEQTEDTDLQSLADSAEQTEDTDLQPMAALAQAAASQPTAASGDRPSKPPAEPIRTLTIARVLARQGYYDRSLSIYDALLKEAPDDSDLRAEAERVRADKAGEHA